MAYERGKKDNDASKEANSIMRHSVHPPPKFRGGFVDFGSKSLGGTLDFQDFSGDLWDELGLKFGWWDSNFVTKASFSNTIRHTILKISPAAPSHLNQFAINVLFCL